MLAINRSKKLIILTVVIIFLLFFLHYIKVLSPLEKTMVYLTRPLLQKTYQLSSFIGKNYLEFKTKSELISENKGLKDQLTILLKEKSEFYSEKEENDFLHQQLNFAPRAAAESLFARVIGKSVDNTQNALIVEAGEISGVRVGQPVLVGNGVIIGKINKVNKNSSFVLLLNDDQSKIAVKIQNQTKTFGVLEGEYGLGLKMRLIPQNEAIKEGDVIVTSGLENLIPANIIVGQVEGIVSPSEELFQEASVKSFVDFNKVALVNIIMTKDVD